MPGKLTTLLVLVLGIVFCSLALPEKPKPKNLKVLSKNISHEELETVMKGFKTALGVKCDFCHAASQTEPGKLDFASDEKEHKLIARDMMRMVMRINKKYFKHEDKPSVTCYTCHRGNEEPRTEP